MKNDGSIETIYCHFDGYLEGVGEMLHNNYQDINKVKELIKLGDIRSLKENVSIDMSLKNTFDDSNDKLTIAYHRDLKENYDLNKPMFSSNLKELDEQLFDTWVGYIYLFDEKYNKWFWDNCSLDGDPIVLKPLDEYFTEDYDIDDRYISI